MIFGVAYALVVAGMAAIPLPGQQHGWMSWRGPNGSGVAPHANPPITWSETENVRFKIALPGVGYGTPIVSGDHILLSAAIAVGPELAKVPDDAPGAHDNATVTQKHEFVVIAVSRSKGEILWQTKVHEQVPHATYHKSSALAAASMVTDGELALAFFGSYGLHCLDMEGRLLWRRDLGDMQIKHGHGEGCSPVLHGDIVVINWDHEGESFVVAFDKRTGRELWRKQRDEVTSWATPIVVRVGAASQLIVSGTKKIRAYDLSTGELIWWCVGLSNNVVASPVSADGMFYAGSSYVRKRMLAVRLEEAKGDLTQTDHIVWRKQVRTPYVPSPLLYGEWLYYLNHYQGFLSRVHAKTGAEPDRALRLPGMREIYSSPVGAANRIYITDRDGATLVLSHTGETPRLLAHNRLDDSFSASAALVDDELYLRGQRYLYCLREQAAGADK